MEQPRRSRLVGDEHTHRQRTERRAQDRHLATPAGCERDARHAREVRGVPHLNRRTGRDRIDNWNFYVAFGVFRLASISQGVYRRALAGVTPSDRPAVNGTPHLAEQALEILYR